MARILVLGGGFGGISAAIGLRERLDEAHTVTLIDDKGSFMMGLSKLWALDGRRTIKEGRRDLDALKNRGIDVVKANVDRIDLQERTVDAGGQDRSWDHLIVALGARLAPEHTPGFDAAHNLYDPEGVTRFGEDLRAMKKGRLLIAVCAMPFKCPPAPYEASMIAHQMFTDMGVRDDIEITLTTPEPKPLPIAGADCSGGLLDHIKQRNIHYKPAHRPARFDADAQQVVYDNDHVEEYDLLAAVPVHKVPQVVVDAGLAPGDGWVKVDPATLATAHENVWAIGDVNAIPTPVGKPLPKAGVFAEAQGKVVAHNLANLLEGKQADARFDGVGYCFIETGDGRATAIRGDFFAQPEPFLELRPPDEAALDEKKAFEQDRLRQWFGN